MNRTPPTRREDAPTPPQQQQQQQQRQLVVRLFLRHAVSAVLFARSTASSSSSSSSGSSSSSSGGGGDRDMGGTACTSIGGSSSSREDRASGRDGAGGGFRPAAFGDVPNHLLEPPSSDTDDDNDGSGGIGSVGRWLDGAGRGALGRLLSGAAASEAAVTLVMATWIRSTDGDGDCGSYGSCGSDGSDGGDDADGVVLERFRFAVTTRGEASGGDINVNAEQHAYHLQQSQRSSSSSSANRHHQQHYLSDLAFALRSIQAYCEEESDYVDPGDCSDSADYVAVGRGVTMVTEEVEEVVEEGEEEGEEEEGEEESSSGGATDTDGDGRLFAATPGGLDPLHAADARAALLQGRMQGEGDGGFRTCTDGTENYTGSSTGTAGTESQNTAGTAAASSFGVVGGTTTMMMAQHSQRSEWTERTGTACTHFTSGGGSMDTPENGHGHSQFDSHGDGYGTDDIRRSMSICSQDSDFGADFADVARFHLGSAHLGGGRHLTVSVERSVCGPESPVVRLLFGGVSNGDDGGVTVAEESEEGAASDRERRNANDDAASTFSASTALPSQETMGYRFSTYRRGRQMHRPSDHEAAGRDGEASIGSMVTPPPPPAGGAASRPRVAAARVAEAVEGSLAPSQPSSQATDYSTQQSSATEGASQRSSRRRKGIKKKQSGRARANAEVAKILGVGRRECIPRTKRRTAPPPPALTPMPPAGSAARPTGKRPALTSALRNGDGSGKRPALSANAANRGSRHIRFSPQPNKFGNGGGANNTPTRRGVGTGGLSRSPAISSTSTVLVGSANNTPVPVAGGSGRSPANSGMSTATVLMSRYGSVSEAETVLMSRTPPPPIKRGCDVGGT